MSAALLTRLIEAGTPADLIAEVAMELARAQAVTEQAEKRKEKDRNRKRDLPRISEDSTESAEMLEKASLEVSPQTPLPNPSKSSPLNPPIFEEKKAAVGSCLRRAFPAVDVPEWMPPSFAEFRAMRKAMRNVPFGASAERRVIAKIEKLRAEGHDPDKLLSKAIERGHRTVFEDDSTKAVGPSGKVEKTAQQLREDAEWFIRYGQPDRATECRNRAIQIEQRAA